MEYIEIPGLPAKASRIALGTWAMGGWMWGGRDDDAAIATIHRGLELGLTLIDTAPAYGQGHAEEVVGRALKGRRDRAVIATKVGLQWDERGSPQRNASAARIRKEIEDSLRRLQTGPNLTTTLLGAVVNSNRRPRQIRSTVHIGRRNDPDSCKAIDTLVFQYRGVGFRVRVEHSDKNILDSFVADSESNSVAAERGHDKQQKRYSAENECSAGAGAHFSGRYSVRHHCVPRISIPHIPPSALINETLASERRRAISVAARSLPRAVLCAMVTSR